MDFRIVRIKAQVECLQTFENCLHEKQYNDCLKYKEFK